MSGVRGRGVGSYYWCTITAPGADRLPWDSEQCTHGPEVQCSGAVGCRVDRFDAAVWNGTAPKRWSWFVTYLRRRLGHCEFIGVWEDQERGVLHRHFLIRLDVPTTDRRVSAAVRNTARRWGFGSRFDVQGITDDAGRAAWYVASYATKTVDRMEGTRLLDVRTGELRRPGRGFRPWSCSRHWGDTVKSVRARQAAWARQQATGPVVSLLTPDGAGGALDPNSDISTFDESEIVQLLRVELGAVLL